MQASDVESYALKDMSRSCQYVSQKLGQTICLKNVILGSMRPLHLSAVKSRMGHTEPAAGGLGIANLATMLGSKRGIPVTFLRQACATSWPPLMWPLEPQNTYKCI